MRMIINRAVILGILCILSLSACTSQPSISDFEAGDSKQELVTKFGEPIEIRTIVKSGHINGPIETLWYQLEDGTEIEIWHYAVIEGTAELYFVNGSDQVTGVGLLDKDAVY